MHIFIRAGNIVQCQYTDDRNVGCQAAVSPAYLLFSTCSHFYRPIIPLTHTHNSDCHVMYKQHYQSFVRWFVGMLQIRERFLLLSDL
jgi:hypothetical protein